MRRHYPLSRKSGLRVGQRTVLAAVAALTACSSSSLGSDAESGQGSQGLPLELMLAPNSRSFVELETPSVVTPAGSGEDSVAWDLAFEGLDVLTNGGISGLGKGSAFGPFSRPTLLSDTAPAVPFLVQDRGGGAFLDWYEYDGATHQLFSRYHVYGLRDGDRFYKLQLLSYYGEQAGAPVSARYRLRYAEVTAAGTNPTIELSSVDATAGGSKPTDDDPSACLDLEGGATIPLSPEQAAATDAWQLCLRRDAILVNGGRSGPGGVEAVDLQGELTQGELPAEVLARTAESQLSAFEAVDLATLNAEDLVWKRDGIVTAFSGHWLEQDSEPPQPSEVVWLVVGADGASKYLVVFDSLAGDPATEAATLRLRAKAVR